MFCPLNIHVSNTQPKYFWHPSVVYISEGLGEHKWWMAQTPYPPHDIKPYRDRFELPCIHYSDDGLRWNSIPCNPIDDISPDQEKNKDYMSDPHLIYKDGRLELFYRLSIRIGGHETLTIILKKTSKDGVRWSEREVVADLRKESDAAIWGEQIISQSVVWTGKEYLCWYVDGSWYVKDRGIRMTSSKDGVHWEKYRVCELAQYDDIPWHIDVQYAEGVYHMLCYSYENDKLYHLTSSDGQHWEFDTLILTHSKKLLSFYSAKIYRSCMVFVNNVYHIYFSAATAYKSYIGLLTTNDWKQFSLVSPSCNMSYVLDIPCMILYKLARKINKILKVH